MVAKLIGDIITGDTNEPDVFQSTVPTVGGLLDSITVGIAIAARTKPIMVQAQPAINTGTVTSGKISLKPADRDALRSFVTSSMPFGLIFPNLKKNIIIANIQYFSIEMIDYENIIGEPDLLIPLVCPYRHSVRCDSCYHCIHEV